MVVLLTSDYMEVKLAGLIADYDKDTLINLYQPIIGYEALAVYFSLWSEANNQKITAPCTHGQLFSRMNIAPGKYLEARKRLEGVGLLQTFLDNSNNTNYYHYELKAPKTPHAFFDDTLLFGMLIKAIGESDANRFKNIYHFEKKMDYGQDISSSFKEIYHPNLDDQAFFNALSVPTSVDRVNAKILNQFSWEAFLSTLSENSQIDKSAFSKKDLKEIERLSLLNGASEKEAAIIVSDIFDPNKKKGEHIDYSLLATRLQEIVLFSPRTATNAVKNVNSGSTELAKKINLMENLSPKQYLYCLQNGTQPAKSDLLLVDDLNKKFKLSTSVINALLDYVLTVNNNIISRTYIEKIAASLAREGVTTAYDTMQYLKGVYRHSGGKDKKVKTVYNNKKVTKEVNNESVEQTEEENEQSWEEMMKQLSGGSNDGKN